MFQPSTRHLKAALAGVLFAWLCLLQGAYGVANLGPEVTDPANFLPPRILVGADVTTSIKPSRPQTLDRQRTASALPHFLSRDPLGESESLNLYSYCGNDPINYVDVNGLAKVALDGKGNLTVFGKALLTIAKDAPEEARAMLMAAQVQREETGANIGGLIGNGDGGSISNVLRAIDTVVGNARTDGREEWRRIAAETGASRDFDNGQATQNIWVDAMFADYAPAIAASAANAAAFNAAQRAASEKQTAYQNSPGYKLREIGGAIADLPMQAGGALASGLLMTDITTGTTFNWNGWGNGYGLAEIGAGERAFAAGMMFIPIGRVGGVADDVARAGTRRLFHYTNAEGLEGILKSGELRPSLWHAGTKDVRYGNGQYLTDIVPGSRSSASVARELIGIPNKYKFTHYLEIDVSDLRVIEGRPGVFVIPNDGPLDIAERILGSGGY